MRAQAMMATAPKKRTHAHCKACKGGVICPDLQRRLSDLNSNRQSKAAKKRLCIENVPAVSVEESTEDQISDLIEKLKSYALPEIYIEVLIRIAVFKWSFNEAADDLSIVSAYRVRDIYNRGIDLLKERKYK